MLEHCENTIWCFVYDSSEKVYNISVISTGVKIVPEEMLIIFDEIQENPKVLASLKYFYEDAPQYPVIAAGSLLGVTIHKGVSFPVGKMDTMELHPLNFREFLLAVGEGGLVKLIEKNDFALMNAFRDKYADWLKKYYIIGGMPEVCRLLWILKILEKSESCKIKS